MQSKDMIALGAMGVSLTAALWMARPNKQKSKVSIENLANRLIEHYPVELLELAKQDFANLIQHGVEPETAFNVLVESIHQ